MASLPQTATALLLAALLGGPAAADDLEKLRQKLAREGDPADRAKITVEIGEELLKQAAKTYKEGAYTDGDLLLEDYRQAIRAAYQDLVESGRDARRKPKGFKHLEIHLRKSRRRLEDMARALPFDNRAPVEETLAAMESLREELLAALMSTNRGPYQGKEKQP